MNNPGCPTCYYCDYDNLYDPCYSCLLSHDGLGRLPHYIPKDWNQRRSNMKTKENLLQQAQAELDAALDRRRVAWMMYVQAGEELEAVRRKIARMSDEKKI